MSIQGFKILSHPAFGKLRVVRTDSGIWFVADDVVRILQLNETDKLLKKYVKPEHKDKILIPQIYPKRLVRVIRHSGIKLLAEVSCFRFNTQFVDWALYAGTQVEVDHGTEWR